MRKIIVLFLLIMSGISLAETYTGSFLRLPAGAANLSGGNGAVLHTSNEIITLNPAFLNLLKPNQFSTSFANYSFDRDLAFLSLVLRNKTINFSLNFQQFQVTDIEERNVNGELTGKFKDKSQLFFVNVGGNKNKFAWGGSVKYLKETVYKQSANCMVFDLGVSYQASSNSVVGYSFRNFNLPGVFSGDLNSKLKWKVDQAWSDKETRYEYSVATAHLFSYYISYGDLKGGIAWHLLEGAEDQINCGLAYKLEENISLKLSMINTTPVLGIALKTELFRRNLIFNYSVIEEEIDSHYNHFFTWAIIPK